MKKEKFLLLTIALFGFIGGALAFKARKIYGSVLYVTTQQCASATLTKIATTTDEGTQKIWITFIYNQPACLYSYTIAKL